MSDYARTPFGAKLKPGVNVKIITEAREYFEETYGVHIVDYEFATDTPSRPKEHVPKKALKACAVCGKELYQFVTGGYDPETEEVKVAVRSSRHFVFKDMRGEKWSTCFKLNSCFKAVGFSPSDQASLLLKPLPFEDFHNLKAVSKARGTEGQMLVEALRANYEEIVYPFMLEWCNKEITKKNVMRFITEFKAVKRRHLVFFEDDRSKSVVANKILTAVGVRNG
jgi:hypothetical protein